MLKEYKSVWSAGSSNTEVPQNEAAEASALPALKYSEEDKDGWIDIDTPILFLNAGKAPFASRFVILSLVHDLCSTSL